MIQCLMPGSRSSVVEKARLRGWQFGLAILSSGAFLTSFGDHLTGPSWQLSRLHGWALPNARQGRKDLSFRKGMLADACNVPPRFCEGGAARSSQAQ